MIIREATKNDRDIIVSFQLAMAQETESLQLDKPTVEKGVSAVLEGPSKGRYFLAESEGEVIGSMMITYEWSDWRNGTVYWIQSVFVDPDHRNNGAFKSLYNHVKGKVEASPDIAGLRLYVDMTNENAQKVYRQLGMDGDHYKVFEWMRE